MSDDSRPKTLLLEETGIARLPDGRVAVNVGPIVAALAYLTEGRGADRGVGEDGEPLPDLLSLAFDVVRSIIVGGRHAEYFRGVKREFDAQAEQSGQTSLALAKQASALVRAGQEAPLDVVTDDLQARLASLKEAAAELVQELSALQGGLAPVSPQRRTPARKRAAGKAAPRATAVTVKRKAAKVGSSKKATKRKPKHA